jgi:hypothetical protein
MNRISIPHACAASGKEYRIAFAMRDGKYRFECVETPTAKPGFKGALVAMMQKAEPLKPQSTGIDIGLFDGKGRRCECGQAGFVYCGNCRRHVCEARSREGWFVCAPGCGAKGRTGPLESVSADPSGLIALPGATKRLPGSVKLLR